MADRTTKILLALIVLALWGLLLRPALTPVPTRADTAQLTAPVLTINPNTGATILAAPDGNLYLFDSNTLQLRARAVYVPSAFNTKTRQQAPATFTNPPLP